jgi:hypothetical protein
LAAVAEGRSGAGWFAAFGSVFWAWIGDEAMTKNKPQQKISRLPRNKALQEFSTRSPLQPFHSNEKQL